MVKRMIFIFFVLLPLLGGCATLPSGPSVMALPGDGKSFDQFLNDDAVCRQWAGQRIGVQPGQVAGQNTATGAVAGTAVGAGLGAALGAVSGNAGAGAAIGAVSGLLIGTSAGANADQVYGWEAQRRYDRAYEQCMYAKGNQIPGVEQRPRRVYRVPPPPAGYYSVPPDYVP
jgi:outer membrane lipoprotein SlyB